MGQTHRRTRKDCGHDGGDQFFETGMPRHDQKDQEGINEGEESSCQENKRAEEGERNTEEEDIRQVGMEEQRSQGKRQ